MRFRQKVYEGSEIEGRSLEIRGSKGRMYKYFIAFFFRRYTNINGEAKVIICRSLGRVCVCEWCECLCVSLRSLMLHADS